MNQVKFMENVGKVATVTAVAMYQLLQRLCNLKNRNIKL